MRIVWVGTVLTLAFVAGCQRQQLPPANAAAEAVRWTRDSAKYQADSARWVRDSVVRDSVSRTVNTDSLYRLNLAMARAANPVPIMGKLLCERARLGFRYGTLPVEAAVKRMQDSLDRVVDKKDKERIDTRLSNMSVEEGNSLSVGRAKCGDQGPAGPQSINGTDLFSTSGRPIRPRPPVAELREESALAALGLS